MAIDPKQWTEDPLCVQGCRWSQKCTHLKTAFPDQLAGIADLVRLSQKAL
jgi:hypothetical protein